MDRTLVYASNRDDGNAANFLYTKMVKLELAMVSREFQDIDQF